MTSNPALREISLKGTVNFAFALILCSCSISINQNENHQELQSVVDVKPDQTETVALEVIQALRTILTWEATLSERAVPVFIGQIADDRSATSSVWGDLRGGFQLQAYYDQASRQGQLNYYLSQENYFETITERGSPFFAVIVSK
jgi:hypothetical protein